MQELSRAYPDGIFVAPEKLHLTVRFFGESEINEASTFVENAIVGVTTFSIELSHIDAFPNSANARTLFCGLRHGACLAPIMHRAGEKRAHPHLTLARFRKPRAIVPDRIEPIEFPAKSVELVQSILGANPHYEAIREWKLPSEHSTSRSIGGFFASLILTMRFRLLHG
jgi:2'-5' RNA ligase